MYMGMGKTMTLVQSWQCQESILVQHRREID